MSKEITESKMQQALSFAYDKAINGVAGLDSAVELAESYINNNDSKFEQANSLIRWQNTKAGTSGFITGLGGLILMPVTLPTNITSVLYVQIRMIASIAHMGGYDLKDDRVKSMVYVCLVGNASVEIFKNAGIQIGRKLATNALKNVSGKVITQINQKVGFRLVTKFGEKGVINLGKTIPVLGGVIGGTIDVISTNTIGNTARNIFIGKEDASTNNETIEPGLITLEELDEELTELLNNYEHKANFVKAKIIVNDDYSCHIDMYFYFSELDQWEKSTLELEQTVSLENTAVPLEIEFTL